jgi:hypothetical protein
MDNLGISLVVFAWLLVVGAALLRVPGGGIRSLIIPWLVFTMLTLVVEFNVLFIAVNGLLFFLGEGAATIGVVISVIVFGATPIAWAYVLRKRTRGTQAHG